MSKSAAFDNNFIFGIHFSACTLRQIDNAKNNAKTLLPKKIVQKNSNSAAF